MSAVNAVALFAAAGGDYQISRSVRLRRSASAYFNRTLTTPTNNKIWTWSGWAKRGSLSSIQALLSGLSGNNDSISFDANNKLCLYLASTSAFYRVSTPVYRDPSAWYHVVVAVDTTQATAQNRARMYVNNSEITAWDTNTAITLNAASVINSAVAHQLGAASATQTFDGYLTEINFIDGQALTPSSFGETDAVTGVWKPKKYAGTYGTNGFYLNFSDPSAATATAIGKDMSGNANNWTPNNISVTAGVTYDSMIDVPTMWADGGNGRGNYATLNPLDKVNGTLSNGNLSSASNLANYGVRSTIAVSSGKFYWEWLIQDTADNHHGVWSIAEAMGSNYVGQTAGSWGIYEANGNKRNNGSYVAYGSAYANGDTGMAALDMDNGKIWWGKNGTWFASGDPAAGSNAAFTNLSGFAVAAAHIQQRACSYNFGQRPFAYTPPTGFKALNTQNLPDATIKKGNQYFDATTYTGNGSTQSIVNSGAMQPDLVWIKRREAAGNNALYDAVRGVGNVLLSNSTNNEFNSVFGVTSFNSNGFSLGSHPDMNASGGSYVGWQWKESVSAGFDIVTYTGTGSNTTVAHSLGVKPSLIIIKPRSSANPWSVYHASVGATKYLLLNATDAAATNSTFMNNTEPTSSVFSLGSGTYVNQNTVTHVAYCFSEVAGFSKFGSYTGNGSADGPFVYCGFRPKFLLVKRSDSLSDWYMVDTSRDTYNLATKSLFADLSDAEGTIYATFDTLSNGFKLRGSTANNMNASGGTYIFAAFAENPFKNSLAR